MFNLATARNTVVTTRRWKSESAIDLLPSSDSISQAHVLAVDDSIIDRKVIETLLKTTSCKVTAVDSGMRALEFLGLDVEQRTTTSVNGLKIDLIITDYCMPGMTGYELLKRIKESSTFKETPVVIMSSENVIARIDRCLEEGAEDFILKPVKLSDMKRIRNCMSKDDKSNDPDYRINKRKQMDGSDQSSESSVSVTTSPSTPSSPCGPLDSPLIPSSPSEPSDSRRLKMTLEDGVDQVVIDQDDLTVQS